MTIIEILKRRDLAQPLYLRTSEEQAELKKAGVENCLYTTETLYPTWRQPLRFGDSYAYILRPDYEPEPENLLVGRTVTVFDRYHFALPIQGCIEAVAEKDGAFKVGFYPNQHGFPNYMKFNHLYFFSEQCKI